MSRAALFTDAGVLTRICEVAQLTAHSCVLDVACGPGIVVEALARHAGSVVACDITPAMLAKTAHRCATAGFTNVRCTLGRAEQLPFEDAAFDAVVSRSAFHHFPDPAAALSEMTRVCRDTRRIIIVDVITSGQAEDAALHNALETLRDPSHVRMLPKSELQRAVEQAGLTLEQCIEWINHREFEEWLAITSAPERAGPLRVVMRELAQRGAAAGIGLRYEGGTIRFDHTTVLVVAVKRPV